MELAGHQPESLMRGKFLQQNDRRRQIHQTHITALVFGADNTGDITNLKNLAALVERSKSLEEEERILLVTADGSIDCTDMPGEQESTVAQLHLCETVACMHLLRRGGSFLLKVFTLFEHQSVCLMYLLSCLFDRVTVTKPACNIAGNSEMYVVCINFKGQDHVAPYLSTFRCHYGNASPAKAMFNLRDIPSDFLRRIEECSEFFKCHQCQVMEDNINTFRAKRYNDILNELSYVKQMLSIKYFKDCRLTQIDPANEIVGRKKLERFNNCIMKYKIHTKYRVDSYNERCKMQDLEPQERLLQAWEETTDIESPKEKSYIWQLRAMPETLEIQMGKSFDKVYSSCFCDSRILQLLNKIHNIIQDMDIAVCFPSATRKLAQQINSNHEILSFQFAPNYDSHQTIIKICDRLEELQVGQTLILVGYSLLTQLNVGLLHLLGNFFDKMIIEIHDNEGYRVKLETYRPNEKVSIHLRKILTASYNAK